MLIDEIMPEYQVRATYNTTIHARKEEVFDAILHSVPFGDSVIIRGLVRLRELPSKLLCVREEIVPKEPLKFYDFLEKSQFSLLGIKENEEIVLGVIGRFWHVIYTKMTKVSNLKEFSTFCEEGFGKAVMNFSLKSLKEWTILSTETRVYFPAEYVKRFKIYWLLIGPFSGMIRKILLRKIKLAIEQKTTGENLQK